MGGPALADPPIHFVQRRAVLLDGDRGAGALEGGLRLLGGLLVDLLQERLRGAVHQVLGLLQAEAGERAHLLDDLDLLLAGRLEDDVELVLLLGGLGRSSRAGAGRTGNRDGRGGGDVEGLLELLHEAAELEEGHVLESVEQLVGAELRHDWRPFRCRRVSRQSVVNYSAGSAGVSGVSSIASAAASTERVSATAASAVAASAAPSAGFFSSSALARRAICDSGAWNRPAARVGSAFRAPASLASSTSRDSRSAICLTSSAESRLPSSTPPLMTSSGCALAKSRSPLAASTGSPLTKAMAVGPCSSVSSMLTPASAAARLVSVFFTTA